MRFFVLGLLSAFLTTALQANTSTPSREGTFEFRLKSQLTSEQTTQVQQFYTPVINALPKIVTDVLNAGVDLYFEEQKEMARIERPKNFDQWISKKPPLKIILSTKLLHPDILHAPADPKNYLKKFFAENLLHETLHLFDYHAPKLLAYKKARLYCMSSRGSGFNSMHSDESKSASRYCDNIESQHTTYSESTRYLLLSNWLTKYTHKIDDYNKDSGQKDTIYRAIKSHEYTNSREHFVFNAVEYLRDASYICRRPRHHAYFQEIFGITPFLGVKCEQDLRVVAHPAYSTLVTIDPERVYSIDLVIVGPGDDLFSKFGHLSFRMNMCKPGQEHSEKCLRNKTHHVAVSFRYDGPREYGALLGGYKTIMQVERYLSLKYTYYDKNQSLFIYPMVFAKEKTDHRKRLENLVYSFIESYWMHGSNYEAHRYNCVTEAFDLFKSVVNDPRLERAWPIFPSGIYKLMLEFGYIAHNDFVKKGPRKSPYYEPSQREVFTYYLEQLKNAFPEIKEKDPFPFILDNDPKSRIALMDRIVNDDELFNDLIANDAELIEKSKVNDADLRTNLKLKYIVILKSFEDYYHSSLPSFLKSARSEWFQLVPSNAHPELGAKRAAFYKAVSGMRYMVNPVELAKSGYGLVQKDEFHQDNWDMYKKIKTDSFAARDAVYEWVATQFPEKLSPALIESEREFTSLEDYEIQERLLQESLRSKTIANEYRKKLFPRAASN